jgi:hypothetical protein
MTRLLGVIVLLLIGVGVLGFYQGWFQSSTATTDHKTTFGVTVDRDKIEQDKEKAKEELEKVGERVKEKTGK